MRLTLLLAILCCASFAATGAEMPECGGNLMPNPELRLGQDGGPVGWETWAPRPDLATRDTVATRDGVTMLSVYADRFECDGRWVSVVKGIDAGKFYRFDASYRTEKVDQEGMSVVGLLVWCKTADGKGELQSDYLDDESDRSGVWRRSDRTIQAPEGARSVRVELGLRLSTGGTVFWKDMRLVTVAPPAPRKVRIVTTQIKPTWAHATVESNTKLMAAMLDRAGREKPDVVLFSECFVDRAVRQPMTETAQPIPGPLTRALGKKAAEYHTYVIASLHERAGTLFYNTAVLIDREGRIAGKYRNVHLALAESNKGLTPGSEYPVFDTDFGRIGIMVCYDNWFLEPARILRLKGAEILFLPMDGDDATSLHSDVTLRERAIDNGVYLVSAAMVTDNESRIINPVGEVLAEATGDFDLAVKEIDLNKEWRVRYLSVPQGLGEGKSLFIKERRPDTYGRLAQ